MDLPCFFPQVLFLFFFFFFSFSLSFNHLDLHIFISIEANWGCQRTKIWFVEAPSLNTGKQQSGPHVLLQLALGMLQSVWNCLTEWKQFHPRLYHWEKNHWLPKGTMSRSLTCPSNEEGPTPWASQQMGLFKLVTNSLVSGHNRAGQDTPHVALRSYWTTTPRKWSCSEHAITAVGYTTKAGKHCKTSLKLLTFQWIREKKEKPDNLHFRIILCSAPWSWGCTHHPENAGTWCRSGRLQDRRTHFGVQRINISNEGKRCGGKIRHAAVRAAPQLLKNGSNNLSSDFSN